MIEGRWTWLLNDPWRPLAKLEAYLRWKRWRRPGRVIEGSWSEFALGPHCVVCEMVVARENVEDYTGGGRHAIVCTGCVLTRGGVIVPWPGTSIEDFERDLEARRARLAA